MCESNSTVGNKSALVTHPIQLRCVYVCLCIVLSVLTKPKVNVNSISALHVCIGVTIASALALTLTLTLYLPETWLKTDKNGHFVTLAFSSNCECNFSVIFQGVGALTERQESFCFFFTVVALD